MLADIQGVIRNKRDSLQRADWKKLFLLNFPYLLFAYVFNKIFWLYRISAGETGWDKFMETLNYFERAFENPLPSFYYRDVFYGILGGITVKLIVYYREKNAKNTGRVWSMVPPDGERKRIFSLTLILCLRRISYSQKRNV